MSTFFSRGEIVWAKVAGFPRWPGIIKSITLKHRKLVKNQYLTTTYEDEPRVLIEFIGDYSHVVLPLKKIDKFIEKFKEYSLPKNKKIRSAIDQAKRMYIKRTKDIRSSLVYEFLGNKRIKQISKSKDKDKDKDYGNRNRNSKQVGNQKHKTKINKRGNQDRKVFTRSKRVVDDDFIENDYNEDDDEEDETYEQEEESDADYNDESLEDEEKSEKDINISLNDEIEFDDNCFNDNSIDEKLAKSNNNNKCNGIKNEITQRKLKDKGSTSRINVHYLSALNTNNSNQLKTYVKDIKNVIEHLLNIKIEKRTKESFKHIIESLDQLSQLIKANKTHNTYSVFN